MYIYRKNINEYINVDDKMSIWNMCDYVYSGSSDENI